MLKNLDNIAGDAKELSEIIIPSQISAKEADQFLKYLANNLPARIDYTMTSHKIVSRGKFDTNAWLISEAQISRPGRNQKYEKTYRFSFINHNICFSTCECRKPGEYSSDEVKLWEDTRRIAKRYFSTHKYIFS